MQRSAEMGAINLMLIDTHRPQEITCDDAWLDGTLVDSSTGAANNEEVPMSIITPSVIHGGALAFAPCFG